ncbi:MAG: VOC family protein [Acidimicrobiales bacterium]
MSELVPRIFAITLFVDDPERSKRFYQKAFDLPASGGDEASAYFKFGDTIVNLVAVPAAQEVIRPAQVGGKQAGVRSLLTIEVDDTDSVCGELARRGVSLLNGPIDRPWGLRTASFSDPDGHIWEVAQELPE